MTESPADPSPGTGPRWGRGLLEVRRTRDDRYVAGVCAGVARHLDLDPVIVRVAVAVLTFLGGAGLILYVAAWVLLPAEDAERSQAAEWLDLRANEPQVRAVGLVAAAVVAALSFLGDTVWSGWDAWWIAIPVGLGLWAYLASRQEDGTGGPRVVGVTVGAPGPEGPAAAGAPAVGVPAAGGATSATAPVPPGPRPPVPPAAPGRPAKPARDPQRGALTALTASLTAIALAVTYLVDRTRDLPWPAYLAVALGVVVLGLLLGTVLGNPGPLVGIGWTLVAALLLATLMPSATVGQRTEAPLTAAEVRDEYTNGLGNIDLDLSGVADPQALRGRTIQLENGVGEITVRLPDGVPVQVRGRVLVGDLRVLDRRVGGTNVDLRDSVPGDGAPLVLEAEQSVGTVEVQR